MPGITPAATAALSTPRMAGVSRDSGATGASTAGRGPAISTAPNLRPTGSPRASGHLSRGNGLLIEMEILRAEIRHAKRAHRARSSTEARLRAVIRQILTTQTP